MNFRMTDKRSFTLEINPATLSTAQQKGVRTFTAKNGKTFVSFYKKKKVLQTEQMLELLLRPHAPKTPAMNDGDTCVNLEIVYMFPHPSNTPKWKAEQLTFMTQRPDADNLSKAIVDCMTKCGFWQDDSMINFRFMKFRNKRPRIDISMETWIQERE